MIRLAFFCFKERSFNFIRATNLRAPKDTFPKKHIGNIPFSSFVFFFLSLFVLRPTCTKDKNKSVSGEVPLNENRETSFVWYFFLCVYVCVRVFFTCVLLSVPRSKLPNKSFICFYRRIKLLRFYYRQTVVAFLRNYLYIVSNNRSKCRR